MMQSEDYDMETEMAMAMEEIASNENELRQVLCMVKFLSEQSFSTNQQAQSLTERLEEQQSYLIEQDQKLKSLEHQLAMKEQRIEAEEQN